MTANDKIEKRQRILDAAQALFARFGPAKTSIADIAKAAGMSSANIYNFFPSKDAIFEAHGQERMGELRRALLAEIEGCATGWERIACLFRGTAAHYRRDLPNESLVLSYAAQRLGGPPQFVRDFHEFLRNRIAEILEDGVARGEFRLLDAATTAAALMDCMVNAVEPVQVAMNDRDTHAARIEAQLALLCHALH